MATADPAPLRAAPRVAPRVWPWVLLGVMLIGTAGANRDVDAAGPLPLAILLAAGALLPAALPSIGRDLGIPSGVLLLGSGLLVGCYFALGYDDGPVYIALPVVTFVLASRSGARDWVRWAVPAAVLVALGVLLRYLWWQPDAGHQHFWQALGAVTFVVASGAIATAARSRIETRAERVGRAATEERLRMAQELHDGVGHGLAVIAMQAGAALHVLDADPARARANLEAIRATSRESLDALRTELAAMSAGTAGTSSPRRPAPGARDLPDLFERVRTAGVAVDVVGRPGDLDDLPDPIGAVVYGVAQEALTNVLRHAQATRATVRFERPGVDRVVVVVEDDGRGSETVVEPGMGLAGMRTRVDAVGGRLTAGPRTDPGETGFRVRAELPTTGPDGDA